MKKSDIKILCVDDEPDILEILKYNLSNEGYNVSTAADGKSAIEMAYNISPNLIIMDVMMPSMDGIEACEKLRSDEKFNDTIIMFLTARGEDYSHVAAYEAGADDYVTKPVKPKVLVSKVKGLLRRLQKVIAKDVNEIVFDDIKIDREKYKVYISDNVLNLPRKEFELLYLLASKPDKVYKREKIMESVWGSEVVVGDRTIDVHIRKLREKIGVMWGSPETTSGGRALKFYASVRIDIRRIETLKIGAEMIGNRVRAKIVKNKVAPPFKEAQFDIMFGQGISREGSLLDVGVDHGIVRKAGAWFTYDEVQLGQGKENSKRFLRENADIALQLETDVYKAVGLIESESNEDISEEETEDTTSE